MDEPKKVTPNLAGGPSAERIGALSALDGAFATSKHLGELIQSSGVREGSQLSQLSKLAEQLRKSLPSTALTGPNLKGLLASTSVLEANQKRFDDLKASLASIPRMPNLPPLEAFDDLEPDYPVTRITPFVSDGQLARDAIHKLVDAVQAIEEDRAARELLRDEAQRARDERHLDLALKSTRAMYATLCVSLIGVIVTLAYLVFA